VASTPVRGAIKERREELKTLLKEVVVKAHQLGLDSEEVLGLLKPLLAALENKKSFERRQALDSIIDLKGLSKSFDGRIVRRGIDFSIGRGRVVGLLGKNRAGKTTVLKCLLGLVKTD